MCYPVKGDYKQYLVALAMGHDIRYNEEVIKISPQSKSLLTASGTEKCSRGIFFFATRNLL